MPEIAYYTQGDFAFSVWRHPTGHLCGYLGVPKGHPWYELHYDDIQADVHGGLTFAGGEYIRLTPSEEWLNRFCSMSRMPTTEELDALNALPIWTTVTRDTPFPHETGLSLWWVGFDCAHEGDFIPGAHTSLTGVYRDEAFVREELDKLATQAAQAANTMQLRRYSKTR